MRNASDAELVAYCRSAMKVGSLSFFFAARLLGARVREAILMLYAWCRHCDDVIDRSAKEAPEKLQVALASLRARTRGAMAGATASRHGEMVFQAFAALARRVSFPEHYPQELLSGMEMDVAGTRYFWRSELDLYCYRVASTVGLMFCHVAGVSDPRALKHASDLGKAMQLTNIARDVMEDAAMGRVYLPAAWLEEAGVAGALTGDGAAAAAVAAPKNRARIAAVTARLLDDADDLYRSGDEGLKFLPLRAAFAVAVARHVYAEIGALVRARGAAAWDTRAIVPLSRKIVLLPRAFAAVVRTLPSRWRSPWRPISLDHVYEAS